MAQRSTNRLAGLPQDVLITDVSESGNEFTAVLPHIQASCPYCNGSSVTSKGKSRPQIVYHLPRGRQAALIHICFPRFYCKTCGRSFTFRPEWIHPWLPITGSLYLDILSDFTSTKSMREIAADNCVSESIVRGIFDSIEIEPVFILPETVCIDEFKGNAGLFNTEKRHWYKKRFQCSIVNGESSSVIDILPEREYKCLREYFMQYPKHEREKVKYLCCDMHSGFARLRHSVFPNSILCIDYFHVVQRLNNAVGCVRIRFQKVMKARTTSDPDDTEAEDLYGLLKNSAHLLAAKESNHTRYWEPDALAKKQKRLADIFSAFPDLRVIYDYVQEFHVLAAQEHKELRAAGLSDWIRRAESSEVKELREAAATIKSWRPYILNGLEFKKNNSTCEGLNKKIKDIKRNASGFKNFENFRKRILLACGSPRLPKDYSYNRKSRHSSGQDNRKGGADHGQDE